MATPSVATPVTVGASPRMRRPRPMPIRASVVTRKTYVGRAKIEPLSRMPRRLTNMMARMNTAAMPTRYSIRGPGNADVMAATLWPR